MRHEFRIAVKRAALERSEGRCEAIGPRYGLLPGMRCRASVSHWHVNYEHWPRGAHDPHPETRLLGNCTAICPACNAWANHHHDTPREAKMKRIADKLGRRALDIERSPKPEPTIRGRSSFGPGRKMQGRNTFQQRGRK